MAYYAQAPDRLSTDLLEGGIEITGQDYREAILALCDPHDGRVITTQNGVFGLAKPPSPEPEPDPEPELPTQQDYAAAIQARVDEVAASRGYHDGVHLASYVASTVPKWAAEAAAFVAWRDAVWTYAHAQLAAVQAGEREQPTVMEFVAELQPISWPD